MNINVLYHAMNKWMNEWMMVGGWIKCLINRLFKSRGSYVKLLHAFIPKACVNIKYKILRMQCWGMKERKKKADVLKN